MVKALGYSSGVQILATQMCHCCILEQDPLPLTSQLNHVSVVHYMTKSMGTITSIHKPWALTQSRRHPINGTNLMCSHPLLILVFDTLQITDV